MGFKSQFTFKSRMTSKLEDFLKSYQVIISRKCTHAMCCLLNAFKGQKIAGFGISICYGCQFFDNMPYHTIFIATVIYDRLDRLDALKLSVT